MWTPKFIFVIRHIEKSKYIHGSLIRSGIIGALGFYDQELADTFVSSLPYSKYVIVERIFNPELEVIRGVVCKLKNYQLTINEDHFYTISGYELALDFSTYWGGSYPKRYSSGIISPGFIFAHEYLKDAQ